MFAFEELAYQNGYRLLAGIDEAGRGPLAGPVVAAACVIPRGVVINGVNDSKLLTPKKRENLFNRLISDPAIVYAVAIVESNVIDRQNIYHATLSAMLQAVNSLSLQPDYLLVDGMPLLHPHIPHQKIIRGDQLSQSIAAASIIAKETRDAIMREHHSRWPQYGFAQHKGYGTEKHLKALELHGPCPIHRMTFAPLKK